MNIPKNVYKEEATELLEELESSLLELEETPDDEELIGRVFRAMHTIKGSGAMFGFDDIAAFTHEVETVFDLVRSETISVTKELINLTLSARDIIRAMLDENSADISQQSQEIVAALRKLVSGDDIPVTMNPVNTEIKKANPKGDADEFQHVYKIEFKPDHNIFFSGTDPLLLLSELGELGIIKTVAYLDKLPSLDQINPESCYVYWTIYLKTSEDINTIKDVFIFVEDNCELEISTIDKDQFPAESLQEESSGDQANNEENSDKNQSIHTNEARPKTAIRNDSAPRRKATEDSDSKSSVNSATPAASVRVPSEKLDNLVDLVGELVTVQARLDQLAVSTKNPEMVLVSEQVERLVSELRDNAMSLRMLPIGTIFSKFKRLVRDLSNELGREVEMITEGADTELDKNVIERLNDPLVHLIRNSIDHGIENPDIRETNGKPRVGIVLLKAAHAGGNVLIQIKDDGAGLDAERIRAKAIEKGIIHEDSELSEKEIFELIFAPGFSTAQKVSNVSGRGVGMDVVRRTIDSLGGSIEVESQKGLGTTISLKIPLTLAIIEGLLVSIEGSNFVFPLSMVDECIELVHKDGENENGRRLLNVRGEIVPYIRLRELFIADGAPPDIEQIVLTNINDHVVGFVVDEVIGEHQTVIKRLNKLYKDIEGISGATILGDGTVALILDVLKLEKYVEREEILNCV